MIRFTVRRDLHPVFCLTPTMLGPVAVVHSLKDHYGVEKQNTLNMLLSCIMSAEAVYTRTAAVYSSLPGYGLCQVERRDHRDPYANPPGS